MAETGTRADPPVAFRFTVKFDNMAPIGFSDCSGLQSEIETLEYAEADNDDDSQAEDPQSGTAEDKNSPKETR